MEGQNMSQFSADKRSYVSAKIIPGFGTLIYMACTDKPELGWDENGFASCTDISDIPNITLMNVMDLTAVPAEADNSKVAEALADAAVKIGLPRNVAFNLASQTVNGPGPSQQVDNDAGPSNDSSIL